jgi:ABC-type branched-subunit amino acid transport system ATPase component/predicted MFS family arabinose efflux permease
MRLRETVRDYLGDEAPRPVAAMFGLNAIDELDNATFNWLAPTILATFGKGVGTFGAIMVVMTLAAPLIALPLAVVADRRRRMPIVLVAAVVWGVFSLLTAFAPVLWILFAARVGSAFGRTVSYPIQAALMSDFYSPKVRMRAMGLFTMASQVGDAIGPLLGATIAFFFGWRGAFVFIGALTVPTLLFCRTVPEPPRGRHEAVQDAAHVSWRDTVPRLWAVRSLRYQFIAGIWLAGAVFGSRIVLAFFFKDSFGVGDWGLGVIGSIAGLAAVFSTVTGARLAQARVNVSPSKGVLWFSILGFGIAGLVFLFALSPTLWVAIPLLLVIAMGFGLVSPLMLSLQSMVSAPELRASALAFGQVVALAGIAFVGVIAGIASVWGNRAALVVTALLFVRGTFHVRTAARYIDADVDRLRPEHVGEGRRTGSDGRPLLLETKGLTASYGPVQVLFGVDLEIREGEIVALLGTNGAGKSTVLNAVSGLLPTDAGNIWFDGEPITGESPERIAARGLVQAPGGRGIFPGLSVAENLRLGAFLLRGDKKVSADRIEAALDLFPALRPMLGRTAGDLSGGQRQMLVLAQAMLLKPKLLLIDELSLGLAPVVVQELLKAVRHLNAEGVTIILVEQSVNLALTLADRAYFMEKGAVRFEGPTAELLARDDLLRSVFFGGATPALQT